MKSTVFWVVMTSVLHDVTLQKAVLFIAISVRILDLSLSVECPAVHKKRASFPSWLLYSPHGDSVLMLRATYNKKVHVVA